MVNDDMAHKDLLCRDGAPERILRGTTVLTDAVRVTLGSRTKSVLIAKKWGRTLVCNECVTMAKPTPLLKLTADGGRHHDSVSILRYSPMFTMACRRTLALVPFAAIPAFVRERVPRRQCL